MSDRPNADPFAMRIWMVCQRVAALVALILTSPLLLALCIAVRLDSPGPSLYSQIRPGRFGVPFRLWKIRSMVDGADKNASLAIATAIDAPEITRVGRVIRDLKLDELPKLISVVRGDMALVGPRPIAGALYEHLEAQLPGFARRLDVLPGVTSLAQVCICENEDVEHLVEDWSLRFEAERHYLQHRCIAYDLLIIGLTAGYLVRKVVRKIASLSFDGDEKHMEEARSGLNVRAGAVVAVAVIATGCAVLI